MHGHMMASAQPRQQASTEPRRLSEGADQQSAHGSDAVFGDPLDGGGGARCTDGAAIDPHRLEQA